MDSGVKRVGQYGFLFSIHVEQRRGTRTWFLTVEKLTASTAAKCFRETTYGSTAEINPRILARRLIYKRSSMTVLSEKTAEGRSVLSEITALIDVCILNERRLQPKSWETGLPLEALGSLAMQDSIVGKSKASR